MFGQLVKGVAPTAVTSRPATAPAPPSLLPSVFFFVATFGLAVSSLEEIEIKEERLQIANIPKNHNCLEVFQAKIEIGGGKNIQKLIRICKKYN